MKSLTLALAGVLTLATSVASANLVTNGSFEAPLQASGSFGVYTSIDGWTGDPDIEVRNNFEGTALDGLNFVELDTFGNSSMAQTITGTGLVRLSFWYSTRATPGRPAGSHGIGFSLGDLSGTVLEDAPGAAAHDWQEFTGIADLGNAGSAVLRFTALGVSDQFGGSIDNVSVAPVPVPGALALLVSGLGALGCAGRRGRT